MAAAVTLLEACAPAGADQLRRMKAALAAMPSEPAGETGQEAGGTPAQGSSQGLRAAVDGAAAQAPGPPAAAPPLLPPSGSAIPAGASDFSFMELDAGLQPKQQSAGSGAAARDAAAPAGAAGERPATIAIPSFRAVQQAERQRAGPGHLFRPSGRSADATPQPAAPRPSGALNPLAFVDGTPARAATVAQSRRAPAAAAPAAADMGAGPTRLLPMAAPAAMAPPAPAAAAPPAVSAPVAGPSALAAAAAAALASAAEGELSDDDSDAEQGAGWLGAVMAAQQRVMGGGGPAKRQAVAAAGRPAAHVAQEPAPKPADGDGPEALSLGDSEQVAGPHGGRLGFMGL